MSIRFNDYQTFPYMGSIPQIGVPINNCKPVNSPKVVSLSVAWNDYSPVSLTAITKTSIPINLSSGVKPPLDRIVAVYIDNTGNDNPVFILFPDTGYSISIDANNQQWFPVITNAYNIVLACSYIGTVGTTQFIFTDAPISPIDSGIFDKVYPQWAASNLLITELSNEFRLPALGDRIYANTLNAFAGAIELNMYRATAGATYTHIKSLNVIFTNNAGALVNELITFSISGNPIGATNFIFRAYVSVPVNTSLVLCNMSGMDLFTDGEVNINIATGSLSILSVNSAYTLRPA